MNASMSHARTAAATFRLSSEDELRETIKKFPNGVFAILDSCDEPLVPPKVSEYGDRAVSLYRGSAAKNFWALAPYLVTVDGDLLSWISENLWSKPWGLFLISPQPLADIRKHFRRLLQVQGPDGKMYFRFYDPRVLKAFLVSSSPLEVGEFFGPVEGIALVEPDGSLTLTRPQSGDGGRALFNESGRSAEFDQSRIDAIVAAQESGFIERLNAHLSETLPKKQVDLLSLGPLSECIRVGIERAASYEITRECDVARYVELACTYLGGFRQPDSVALKNHLLDRRYPIADRLDKLEACLESLRDEA